MPTYQDPPPELQRAITNASRNYGVPTDVLTGIWRVESGSSYPNLYVNSAGYGGLFGTTDWNGSPQSQANTSAQILANLISQNSGNVSAALYAYSGGGYTSVPGQTTQNDHGAIATQPPRPTGNVTLDSSITSDVEGFVAQLPIVGGIIQGAQDASDAVKMFVWLLSPKHWAMMAEAVVGSILLGLGLYWYGTSQAGDVPDDVNIRPKDLAATVGLANRGPGKRPTAARREVRRAVARGAGRIPRSVVSSRTVRKATR